MYGRVLCSDKLKRVLRYERPETKPAKGALSRHHHFLPLQQVLTPPKACYFNNCFYTVPNTHLFPSSTTHIQVSYFTSRCYLHLEPILILFDIQLQTRLYKAKNPTCIIQDQAGGNKNYHPDRTRWIRQDASR
jgi:hypothetical protein